MKKRKVILVLYFLSICLVKIIFPNVSHAGNTEGTGEVDGYKLVWQDLFEGETLNEAENWEIEIDGRGNGNNELQYYRRENISIGNEPVSGKSCLVLSAKKEDFSNKNFTSGRLTTQNKMSFKYGKIEARIKMPATANGLWPAFWLLGADYVEVDWPRCGEIDIMEMGNEYGIRNNVQDKYFNGACHWGYYENNWYPNYANHKISDYGLQEDFHLFTLIWDEQSIRMYLDLDKYPDATPYYEMNITDRSEPKSVGNYFHKPYFVIFNLAVGGNFTGIWDMNGITALSEGEAKMYVDFVKLYQRGDMGEEFSGIPASTQIIYSEESKTPSFYYSPDQEIVSFSEKADQISLFTVNGAEMKKKINDNFISIRGVQKGLYIVQAVFNKKITTTQKIIVN